MIRQQPRSQCRLLLVLLIFSCCCRLASSAWTLRIGPYEEACFLVRVPKPPNSRDEPQSPDDASAAAVPKSNKSLSGSYELLDQRLSAKPLVVYVMMDEKVVWHSKPNTPYDRFHVELQPDKRYWMCLQNTSHGPLSVGDEQHHPDGTPRVIGFHYRVHDTVRKKHLSATLTKEQLQHFGEWMESAEDVKDDLRDFYDHFGYIKRRESDHRALVEHTFSACLTWTFLEAGTVILMALGQVLFYRRFLEKQSKTPNYY